MTETDNLITNVDILDEAKENFLTYASEVLLDRAIPAAEDGLLSSQRKIIWTMEEILKMDNKSPTKKSQAVVGTTQASSYVHGDAACYGVLCKMSQEYLMRYPLISGQGSLGTQEDNSSVASPRYTEVKPSIYADLMMEDFKKNTVPLKETYNAEYMEPVFLPSVFPNAICNGRQGIGVSISSNTCPHNLTEVCDAIIYYINNNRAIDIDAILHFIPGPDFPLGNVITNSQDIREAFETGKSKVSLKVRGDYEIKGNKIIFTTIPYRTYRNKIREQINKNLDLFSELINDFNDESNLGQNRLIFEIKEGVPVEKVLNALFAYTDLQTTISYNMNFVVNGTPRLCSMADLIKEYVIHQENVLVNAAMFDKDKAERRAHILEGLIAAVDKISEVIKLIKESENKQAAMRSLTSFLSIDEIQAKAILDMTLGRLTKISKQELIDELEEKRNIIEECNKIINERSYRNIKLIEKVQWLKDHYGDARRTKLESIEEEKVSRKKEIIEQNCTILLLKNNILKRADSKDKEKKNAIKIFNAKNTEYLMVFTSLGKVCRILINNIPSSPTIVSNLIKLDDNEEPLFYTVHEPVIFVTKEGYVKKMLAEEFSDVQRRNKVTAINLREGDELIFIACAKDTVAMISHNGYILKFKTEELPEASRVSKGIKGMKLVEGDYIVGASSEEDFSALDSAYKTNTIIYKDLPIRNRNTKGGCYSDLFLMKVSPLQKK